MAIISGLAESFAPGSNEYVRTEFDVSKDKYYRPDRTSILLLTGKGDIPGAQATKDQKTSTVSLESKVVDQMEFEVMTHDARLTMTTTFTTGTLATGTAGTAAQFTVTDASIFRPYDVILNETTGEQMLITVVDTSTSPHEITAYPGFNSATEQGNTSFPWTLSGIAATTKTNGDVARIIGNAFPEGSTAGSIIDSRPTTAVNYIQVFREEFGVSYEEMQTKKNGRMELEDKDERALGDMLKKVERSLVEGFINKVSTSAGTVRTMTGIKNVPSTNVAAVSTLTGTGSELSVPRLDQIADTLAPGNLSGSLIALCSGGAIRKLRELMDNKVEINVEVGSEEFGISTYKYNTPFLPGGIKFLRHDIMDQGNNSDEILYFDPKHFELVTLKGGELGYVSEKKGLPSGTANNDKMAMQDAHYMACSLEFRHEAAGALYTGHTYTVAS